MVINSIGVLVDFVVLKIDLTNVFKKHLQVWLHFLLNDNEKKVKLLVSLISHILVDPIMMFTDTLLNFIFM